MADAMGVRISWTDLPAHVRAAVETIIGSPVVEAVSQAGGFSPGTADRVVTADGRRAFVKAVSPAQNERTPELHRQEARVTAALPSTVPAPRFLGCYDDGEWIALVLQDIQGDHPATPWRTDELDRVLAALDGLGESVPGLPTAADTLAEDFTGWRRVRADPPADLHPWAAGYLDELCALAERGRSALTGDALVHTDIRADNILLGSDGAVTVVDWPWACRGPAWLDSLLVLINVRLHGGIDTGARLAAIKADPADLVAVLTGLAGFFTDIARQPPPIGLPTLRAFQRAQADALLPWLRELLD